MIIFLQHYKTFEDSRGFFKGIINTRSWKEINYLSTLSGQIRGNHYHQYTDELFFLLEGEIIITAIEVLVDGTLDTKIEEFRAKKGDIFIIEKMTHHCFEIIENSLWINALTLKMDSKNPDILKANI